MAVIRHLALLRGTPRSTKPGSFPFVIPPLGAHLCADSRLCPLSSPCLPCGRIRKPVMHEADVLVRLHEARRQRNERRSRARGRTDQDLETVR